MTGHFERRPRFNSLIGAAVPLGGAGLDRESFAGCGGQVNGPPRWGGLRSRSGFAPASTR